MSPQEKIDARERLLMVELIVENPELGVNLQAAVAERKRNERKPIHPWRAFGTGWLRRKEERQHRPLDFKLK